MQCGVVQCGTTCFDVVFLLITAIGLLYHSSSVGVGLALCPAMVVLCVCMLSLYDVVV